MAAEAGESLAGAGKRGKKAAKGKNEEVKPKGISLPTTKGKTAKGRQEGGKAKGPVAPPSDDEEGEHVEDDDEDTEAAIESDEESEADVHLHGFSTDDEDSSDEEVDVDAPGLDVGKLPTIAKDDATVKRKLERAKREKVCFTH
jgi:nucleolar protein 15